MSIAQAISSAMSGLTATARGTETVAANLANAMTPGYARRETVISAQTQGAAGGVRVDGIARIVNATLLNESRIASSSGQEAGVISAFQVSMEGRIGLPGEASALSTALSDFQNALTSAATRPDDEIRLTQLASAASTLAGRLNTASDAVQAARGAAQTAIATDVETLNGSLERVAYLNTRIAALDADGTDASVLRDERQSAIDRIAAIVPVQEVARDGGKVALFTAEGAVLLDGNIPASFGFQGAGQVTADQEVGAGLQLLTFNGKALDAGQMKMFAGGSLSAQFTIRDQLAPQMQAELDALALDLHDRMLPADGGAGVFTDQGAPADAANLTGLAGRLRLNAAADTRQGGSATWLRDGGTGTVAAGDGTRLNALNEALSDARAATGDADLAGNATLADRFGTIEARVSTRRIDAESDLSIRQARVETISGSLLADGVDTDAEMQKLLQYEQSYAANARVLVAIEDMLDQILRM
ncbi:flagellar hook-associated protein FlgK [Paracoccus sp. 1_MG-2023]|uniref:flagellar hook-associated protein FlgK n=1 Tax=unclassified Paracoccus (in: a-proteobacteria) TaxID=2688777 RepID=UPI001C089FCC|nr:MULTISPECIES: flagellar hook-associated protein FlgK [unclassified Paracoccus (in: a-proteobacteria)]MBU2956882.1 flagellar hook-associated protein FlgK [Paracoccus sp. C2R09]MDO6668080.1 flagellar hook-associated protein FlgK [Paracoccus sp. 1_MG-2023]